MVALPPKLSHAQKQFHQLSRLGIDSFRFEEHKEYEYEYEIELKVFGCALKNNTPRKASFYFLSPKRLAQLFTLKEVKPSPDSKMINFLYLITCSCHYDISR